MPFSGIQINRPQKALTAEEKINKTLNQGINVSSLPSTVGTNLQLTTSASGTPYVAFADQACVRIIVSNDSTSTLEYQRNGAGVTSYILPSSYYIIEGITNANQISIRRKDTSSTQITIGATCYTN